MDDASRNAAGLLRWMSILLLVAGLGLIVFSFTRSELSASRAAWTEKQAQDYQAMASKLHSLSHQSLRAPKAEEAAIMTELKKTEAEYGVLRTQLESAMARPRRLAWLMRIGGVLLLAAGAAIVFLPVRDGE